jgi:cytochrome c oxidase subunit 2
VERLVASAFGRWLERMRLMMNPLDNLAQYLPAKGSTFADETDFLFDAILWISIVSFVAIVVVMVWFAVIYRRRPGYVPKPSPSHSLGLELVWTIGPSLILVWIFFQGASGYATLKTPVNNAQLIEVKAFQFGWQFTYPNGEVTDTLHLSVNQPVRLQLISDDVIHSFYVPEFRAKMDVMPGRKHSMWFKPTLVGNYKLFCTEYCGEGHSKMVKDVIVHPEPWTQMLAKNVRWKDDQNHPIANGHRLYNLWCAGCHSYDGSAKTGPSFKGLASSTSRDFATGAGLSFAGPESDEWQNYIFESIWKPDARIVRGYPNQMPSFEGKLSADQIGYIIQFLKAVDGGTYVEPPKPAEVAGAADEAAAAK